MKLLDRYIAKTVLSAIALVTLMLAGLQIFILFVGQLGEIGTEQYGIVQVMQFVFLQMPYQVYLFFPMASLLGCLIGLGIMANHHELVVMRAAGMSIGQVTIAVFKAAIMLIVLATLAGETLVPTLAHFANEQKLLALSNGQTLRTIKGIWVRYQNDYINIGTMMPDNHLLSVNQFSFDNEHRLRLVRKIERIDYKDGVWRAYGIAQTMFYERRTEVRHFDTMKWDVLVKPNFLGVSNREVDEMTLPQLHQYLADQKTDRRISYPYRLAYLHRLLQPITTLVMMVLAIPFIFGPLRSSTMGSKLLVGASVGFGFYIINKFFGLMSQVMQWPAEIAAFVPTSVFALLGLYLMRRVR